LKGANGCANACSKSFNNGLIRSADLFPLKGPHLVRCQKRKLTLESSVGAVEVLTDYGQVSGGGDWVCPQRQAWAMGPHQKMTPALQDKLCFTVTLTGSYESASQVALKWGCKVDDAKLHALVQRVGAKAQEQVQQRIKTPALERQPQQKASQLGVLLLDGWQVRHRGAGWGRKKTQQNRVEWHEMKMGVYYGIEQALVKENGRGQLADKVVVSTLGDAVELGQRLHWEALRGGLGRAKNLEMVADGSAWIWNLKQDRWKSAVEVLDFYHASQHVWGLGRSLNGEAAVKEWVEPLLHQLRHGKEKKFLKTVAAAATPRGERGDLVRSEQNYFAGQQHRMKYQQIARRGWPIGSGAVESACRQRQFRFKRPGQFWTAKGLRNLSALEEARHNHHWEELWQRAKP
jgi:hypothetical protein